MESTDRYALGCKPHISSLVIDFALLDECSALMRAMGLQLEKSVGVIDHLLVGHEKVSNIVVVAESLVPLGQAH